MGVRGEDPCAAGPGETLCQPANVVKQLGPEYLNRRDGGVQEVCWVLGCLVGWGRPSLWSSLELEN